MADWKISTCPVLGDAFMRTQTLDWPVPLTGEVTLRLEGRPGEEAKAVSFELQTDFSGRFSAFASDGPFELRFLHTEDDAEPRHVLTGAVVRHREDAEDVEAFTAVTAG